MRDVSSTFEAYREGVRHLWNTQFLGVLQSTGDTWALRDTFDDVCASLFAALVLGQLGIPISEASHQALPGGGTLAPKPMLQFHVVPRGPRAPIHINRTLPRGGYWDHPPTMLLPGDADLRFVRWYDFDELGRRDLKYYEVHIVASSTHPQISGRAALIECEYCTVHVDSADATSFAAAAGGDTDR